jgi:hypothetical protein
LAVTCTSARLAWTAATEAPWWRVKVPLYVETLRIGSVRVPVPPVAWVWTVPEPVAPPKIPVPPTTCQVPSSVPRLGPSRPFVVRANRPALVLIVTALWS